LVGGTALSLQRGHRISVDIDLFSDATYGSLDFDAINQWFVTHYPIVQTHHVGAIGFGISYFIGHREDELVKVDIYYTDKFIRPLITQQGIRMADPADIIAMKMAIIGHGGRKKDFWDLHDLRDDYTIPDTLEFYQERDAYGFTAAELRRGLTVFTEADDDFEPLCLRGKHWELIRYDFVQWMKEES
jgi:hypothetical protein